MLEFGKLLGGGEGTPVPTNQKGAKQNALNILDHIVDRAEHTYDGELKPPVLEFIERHMVE